MTKNSKEPNPVDIHVGSRLRLRRTILGISQEKLGEAVGITFQQIQKYEKGLNRIGASRLQQIAEILQIPISFFFEDQPTASSNIQNSFTEGESPNFITDFLSTPEGMQLSKAFAKIKDPKIRKKIVELVRSLADDE